MSPKVAYAELAQRGCEGLRGMERFPGLAKGFLRLGLSHCPIDGEKPSLIARRTSRSIVAQILSL